MTKTEALLKARDQFLYYATQHRAKGTPEADAKAVVNDEMATMCDRAAAIWEPAAPFDDQAAFMRACGQTVDAPNPDQAALYSKLIIEEFEELQDAWMRADEVEQADAVMDLIVVLAGFAHSKGWPVEDLWREVVRSNMAKVDPATGKVRRREDGKILKPDGWTPPDLASILAQAAL